MLTKFYKILALPQMKTSPVNPTDSMSAIGFNRRDTEKINYFTLRMDKMAEKIDRNEKKAQKKLSLIKTFCIVFAITLIIF